MPLPFLALPALATPALISAVLSFAGGSVAGPLLAGRLHRRQESADTNLKDVQTLQPVVLTIKADWERQGVQIRELETRITQLEARPARCSDCPLWTGQGVAAPARGAT